MVMQPAEKNRVNSKKIKQLSDIERNALLFIISAKVTNEAEIRRIFSLPHYLDISEELWSPLLSLPFTLRRKV